jgi:hypothetical protein
MITVTYDIIGPRPARGAAAAGHGPGADRDRRAARGSTTGVVVAFKLPFVRAGPELPQTDSEYPSGQYDS